MDPIFSPLASAHLPHSPLASVASFVLLDAPVESSEDTSHVFSVTPTCGLLRSKDQHAPGDHCQRLEISFTARWRGTVRAT